MVKCLPGTTFELILPQAALVLDGHSIVEAEGLNWKYVDSDADLEQERIAFGLEVFIVTLVIKGLYLRISSTTSWPAIAADS